MPSVKARSCRPKRLLGTTPDATGTVAGPVVVRSGARSILGQRPIQFCIFLKALVGVQEMQRLMVQAIAGAKQVG